MYKSPIDIVTTNIMTEIVKEQENQVFKAVQNVGVFVDKEELLKALQYDRKQYHKGYVDGVKEFAERLREKWTIASNEPYTTDATEVLDSINNIAEEMESDCK